MARNSGSRLRANRRGGGVLLLGWHARSCLQALGCDLRAGTVVKKNYVILGFMYMRMKKYEKVYLTV